MITLSFLGLAGIDGPYRTNIPLLNTGVCLYHLFQRYVILPKQTDEAVKNSHYYTYLTYLNPYRQLVLAIPIFGMIIILLYDVWSYSKFYNLINSAIKETNPSKKIELYNQAMQRGEPLAIYNFGAYLLQKGPYKDEKKAFQYLELAAYFECPEAIVALAKHYATGIDVEKDEKKALCLYTKAADLGNIDAQVLLGWNYMYGEDGTPQDHKKGLLYFEKAIAQKSSEAMRYLGDVYYTGVSGIPRNLTKAISLYEDAAYSECPEATLALARYYAAGIDVEKDEKKALFLYTKAADLGHNEAQFFLGNRYLNEECGVNKNLSKAVHYLEQAIAQKNTEAMVALANEYMFENSGLPKDLEKAVPLYEKAADLGHTEAQFFIGMCFLLEKYGVNKNLSKAVHYLEQAIAQNNTEAMLKLANAYLLGALGLPKDLEKAILLYEKAADLGHIDVQVFLGSHYMYRENGIPMYGKSGIPQDHKKGLLYLEKAIAQKSSEAMRYLGDVYYTGVSGIPKNLTKAISLYEDAANLGNAHALFQLGELYLLGSPNDHLHANLAKAIFYFEQAAKKRVFPASYNAMHRLAFVYNAGINRLARNIQLSLSYHRQARDILQDTNPEEYHSEIEFASNSIVALENEALNALNEAMASDTAEAGAMPALAQPQPPQLDIPLSSNS